MSKCKRKSIHTVAFYNVENLFDTKNDPFRNDDDYTPAGSRRWSLKKYHHKLRKLGSVISQIGKNVSAYPPTLVGLAEVENSTVVNDLTNSKYLKKYHYDYVHYESSDERGIDVALMYNKQFFEYLSSKTYQVLLFDEEGARDYTRDILLVSGNLNGELVHIIVNHWPSRREGKEKSEYKRIEAANVVRNIINDLSDKVSNPKLIIMGDFNDNPDNSSIQEHLVDGSLYNPMNSLFKKGQGSLSYNGKWNLFDQIIFSKNFFNSNESIHTFIRAEIFKQEWLKVFKGKLKGSPFRTYIGPWYKGGFSDHLPVYVYFQKDI